MFEVEMCRKSSIAIAACAALSFASIAPCTAGTLYVSKVGNGYAVYNPHTNKTVYTKDVNAYVQKLYKDRRVDGFGKAINQKTFAKGSDPVGETAAVAAEAVDNTASAAYNVANRYPAWRHFTAPLRSLFGGNSQQSQR